MTVDIVSLIVGAIVAAGLGIGIYSQRHRITAIRTGASNTISSTKLRISKGAEGNYRDAVVKMADAMHIAGHIVPLSQVVVKPTFITRLQPFDPLEEENFEMDRPHQLVPRQTDWLQMLAPYKVPGIALEQLLRGEDHIALLGLPGSGRTVTMALVAMLTVNQTEERGALQDEFRLPIYFHCGDVNLDPTQFGENANPLKPMLDAAAERMPGLSGRLVSAIQGVFARGAGLIMADGWDELPKDRQAKIVEWLRVLMEAFPDNRLIVAGGAKGYGPLQELGLAPVFMKPWDTSDFAEMSQRWAQVWNRFPNQRSGEKPPAELIKRAALGNRGRTPLDGVLHVWATFAGDDPQAGRTGWYDSYLRRVLPAPALRGALEHMAEQIVLDTQRYAVSIETLGSMVDTARATVSGRDAMGTADFIYDTTNKVHVLTENADKSLSVSHPMVMGYLAACAMKDRSMRKELLVGAQKHDITLQFLAEMHDMSEYTTARLTGSKTVLQERVLEMAAWLRNADPRAGWRAPIFSELRQLFAGDVQYPATRERTAAALVATYAPEATAIFRDNLGSPDETIRILSVLGIGAIGDPEAVAALKSMITEQDPTVEVAIALALGAIGSPDAMNHLIQILMNSNDLARRAAAEMLGLANVGGEGHDILREAAQEEDSATRKAAIYGLHITDQPWAVEMLQDMEKHDTDWLVKATAALVMDLRREGRYTVPTPTSARRPEESVWLVTWLAERDEIVGRGLQGINQLVRVLQEGDDTSRLAAAEALGALGASDAVKSLYAALRDEHHEIRDAAYRSLGMIGQASGYDMPAVF